MNNFIENKKKNKKAIPTYSANLLFMSSQTVLLKVIANLLGFLWSKT